MQNCALTISTMIDGKESVISQKGAFKDYGDTVEISYLDGESKTQVCVGKNTATIRREGDYGMELSLIKGERTQGSLLIAGSVGRIELFTHLAEYLRKSDKYLITLRYDILYGEEEQRTQVRILVKNNG